MCFEGKIRQPESRAYSLDQDDFASLRLDEQESFHHWVGLNRKRDHYSSPTSRITPSVNGTQSRVVRQVGFRQLS